MISVEEFTSLIETEFDIESNSIHPNLNYRDIPDFSSMHALIIIALIDSEFDVLLNGSDLKSTQTINDLYSLVLSKLNK